MLVSIGTGSNTAKIRIEDAKNYGLLQWAPKIIDVVFDGTSQAVDYQASCMVPNVGGQQRYFRFQTELKIASDSIDNVTEENLEDLLQEGAKLVNDKRENINNLLELLIAARQPV